MPGVHMAAPVTLPHVEPIGPPIGAQAEPVQQTLGAGAGWGVHVRPGAHAPVVSQKQPWVPTMHVDVAPMPPPPEPEEPEDPEDPEDPELDAPELLVDPPDASSPMLKVLPLELPLLPPVPGEAPDGDEPPQAPIAAISETEPKIITPPVFHVRIIMTSPHPQPSASNADEPGDPTIQDTTRTKKFQFKVPLERVNQAVTFIRRESGPMSVRGKAMFQVAPRRLESEVHSDPQPVVATAPDASPEAANHRLLSRPRQLSC